MLARVFRSALGTTLGAVVAVGVFSARFYASPALAQGADQKKLAVIPPNKDTDLKLYKTDGTIVKGAEALARMQGEANLILWLAGNQFFAMDEVIDTFQKANPGISVELITLPPASFFRPSRGAAGSMAARISGRPGCLCLGQSRASEAAQGCGPDEHLRDLHA